MCKWLKKISGWVGKKIDTYQDTNPIDWKEAYNWANEHVGKMTLGTNDGARLILRVTTTFTRDFEDSLDIEYIGGVYTGLILCTLENLHALNQHDESTDIQGLLEVVEKMRPKVYKLTMDDVRKYDINGLWGWATGKNISGSGWAVALNLELNGSWEKRIIRVFLHELTHLYDSGCIEHWKEYNFPQLTEWPNHDTVKARVGCIIDKMVSLGFL